MNLNLPPHCFLRKKRGTTQRRKYQTVGCYNGAGKENLTHQIKKTRAQGASAGGKGRETGGPPGE